MKKLTSQFIEALERLEQSEDSRTIAELFAKDAQLCNPRTNPGSADPESFWKAYRGGFDKIQSEFTSVVEDNETAMLEWTSSGAVKGQEVSYGGVSVLEFEGEKIKSFRAYFDPGQLVAHAKTDGPADRAQKVTEDAQREAAERRSAGGYS